VSKYSGYSTVSMLVLARKNQDLIAMQVKKKERE
jgi:hypothetical protein